MRGRVIQGFFIGGRPRPSAAPMRAPIQRAVPGAARSPGPPAPAFVAAQTAQRHGGNGSFEIDPLQVGLANGGGSPLPKSVLAKMEAAFGADFSSVRVHVGPQASRIGAVAFTMGDNVYFAPGQFQPDTVQGQQLLGHELAHVVQQRQGRVRAPGSGVAVVQDRMLEAEADRLGMQAAAHRMPVQAKMAGHGRAETPVHISAPHGTGPGSYKLTAGSGGNPMGSLVVHTKRGAAAEVTDLGVDARFRDQGIGRQLLVSAARAGLRSGNSKLSLSAQDNGSGKLTRWYKELGFQQIGVNGRGFPLLEAPIGRLLAGTVQRRIAPLQRAVAAAVTTTLSGAPITGLVVAKKKNIEGLYARIGKKDISPSGTTHAEETICSGVHEQYAAHQKDKSKGKQPWPTSLSIEMNAWPCSGCDGKLAKAATDCKMKIYVTVTGDKGGYSADHKLTANSTGTITYG